jgi:5-methylcytosine-specific restriction endonuclease McrA
MIQKYEINSDHFLGQARNQGENHRGPRKAKAKEILILRNRLAHPQKTYKLRRAMIEIGIPYNCFACGIDGSWNGQPLMLTVDHINGCRYDNRRENLRFLCPNCHSQTLTFGNSLGLTDVTTCKRRDKYYWQKRLAKG